jgi:23S rRNA (cytidine1920-2'-O)/16S rRNA (cytidine1409-2'-O)-methyltransferase
MPSMRLDQALVSRGLVESRTKAQRRIDAGEVSVDGVTQTKHALPVGEESTIELHGGDDYVGRGALKLLCALDHWGISVEGATALDLGASTGGFTQVLLERGAQRVVALDVGHGQLHPSLVADQRVTLCEGINVRYLDPQWWSALGVGPIDCVVADLSFISLTHVFAPVTAVLGATSWIALVKPQFEVGRTGVTEGIATDPAGHASAIDAVVGAAEATGLNLAGIMPSPITGEAGNREYLCWFTPTRGRNQTQWTEHIHHVTHS